MASFGVRAWPHMTAAGRVMVNKRISAASSRVHSSASQLVSCSSRMEPLVSQPSAHLPSILNKGLRTSVPIEEAKLLHPAFYTDPGYAQYEVAGLFGSSWFAAAHTCELANPGDVKVVEVGGTSIILTRDRKGKLHAFYNSCRHRGARVCQTSTTNCKQLVCPYHWWSYRLDGTLKATPPAVTPKERKENLGLQRIPGLETFAGIIFLNQSVNPPAFLDLLGDLPSKLSRYDLESAELHAIKDYTIKGNWKLVAENFVDFYHVNAVHPALAQFSRVDDHKPYQGSGQYVGFVTEPLTDCGGAGDSKNFNRWARINAAEESSALFFQIFPNISVTIYPHSMYTLMTMPGSAPGETREQLSVLMAPGACKEEDDAETYEKKKKALIDFVVQVNDEDVVAIENLQVGLGVAGQRDIAGEFLPEYDWPVHRFQNLLLSAIQGIPFNEKVMPKLSTEFEGKVAGAIAA